MMWALCVPRFISQGRLGAAGNSGKPPCISYQMLPTFLFSSNNVDFFSHKIRALLLTYKAVASLIRLQRGLQ
ncbi:MAG: hypothetical protein ACI83W_002709 [Marinoscillum sp.]|jgi:hypothetical protein